MHEKKSFSTRVDEFLGGKGFYIVLFVCVAVIGVSAWLLLFSRFSPLPGGDTLDYVDAMGDDVTPNDSDTGEKAGVPTTPGGTTPPEHRVPEDTAPPKDTDALTVRDDPKDTAPKDTVPESTVPKAETQKPKEQDRESDALKPEDLAFTWPVMGRLTTGYSPDALIYSRTMGDWRTHDGIDIEAEQGTRVLSCASGVVTRVYTDDLMGTTVVIDHGAGVVSTCSNLASVPAVKEGDTVTIATVIGSVGSTALGETNETPHLHFSLTVNGKSVDPTQFLPKLA